MSKHEVTNTRNIPTAAEARIHPLAKTVRNAARAAARESRPFFVVSTYTGYSIQRDEDAVKVSDRYFRVYADHADVMERGA